MSRPFPKFTRGAIALVALSFVSVLGLVLAGYFAISQQSMRLSNRSYGATVSEQLAELGLEEALRALNTNNFADWTSGTAPDQTTVDWTLTAATATNAATATATITPPATRYGNAGVAGTAKIRIDNYDAFNRPATWTDSTPTIPISYRVGDLISDAGTWYRCVQNHTAAAASNRPPNLTFWVPAPIPWQWSSDTTYALYDVVNYLGIWYRCIQANIGVIPLNDIPLSASPSWPTIPASRPWTISTSYELHDVVRATNAAGDVVLYRCIDPTPHISSLTSFTNDSAKWSTSVISLATAWTGGTGIIYTRGAIVYNAGTALDTGWYQCAVSHDTSASIDFATDLGMGRWAIIAPANPTANTWSPAPVRYVIGDYVFESSTWYRCLVEHVSDPSFATDLAAARWTTNNSLPSISWGWRSSTPIPNNRFNYNRIVYYSASGAGTWYRCTSAHNNSPLILPTGGSWENALTDSFVWSAAANYNIADEVFRSGSWYRCIQAHLNQGPPNATFWSTAPLNSPAWDPGIRTNFWSSTAVPYKVGDPVFYSIDGNWYRCILAHPSSVAIVPTNTTYWATTTNPMPGRQYAIDDMVTYGGIWYRCRAAHNGSSPVTSTTNWDSAANATFNWTTTTAYTTASRVVYGGVWYRCVLANTNIAPGNATYWIAMGAPVVYAEGTATLIRETVPLRTQFRANVAPAPLVPNAVAGTTTLTISGAGTVDSYDGQRGTYPSQTPGFSAVLAAGQTTGTAATITNTRVHGYVAVPSSSTAPHAPLASFGGSAVVAGTTTDTTVDQRRVSRSPFIPQFDTLPEPTSSPVTSRLASAMAANSGAGNFPRGTSIDASDLSSATNDFLILGTAGATTPSRYFFNANDGYITGNLNLGNPTTYNLREITIVGPVILYVNGYLRIRGGTTIGNAGIIDIKSTGSLELHCAYLRTYSSSHGLNNRTLDSSKLTIIADSAVNTTTSLDNGSSTVGGTNRDFYGVIYAPNTTATLGLDIRTGTQIYGAISAREVTFSAEANVHYDTTLRSTAIPGVERAFLLTDWRELTNPAERVSLP